MTSLKKPAVPYLDTKFERSSRNSTATTIIRSASRSFCRYVKRSTRTARAVELDLHLLLRAFLTLSLCFVFSLKSTSPSWVGLLRKATSSSSVHGGVERPLQTTHKHTYSGNVEVRSAKWCEFQYLVSAVMSEQSFRESGHSQRQLLVEEGSMIQDQIRRVEQNLL